MPASLWLDTREFTMNIDSSYFFIPFTNVHYPSHVYVDRSLCRDYELGGVCWGGGIFHLVDKQNVVFTL